jgi:hypothetical protein
VLAVVTRDLLYTELTVTTLPVSGHLAEKSVEALKPWSQHCLDEGPLVQLESRATRADEKEASANRPAPIV